MNMIAITAVMALALLAVVVGSVVTVSDLIYKQYNDRITLVRLEQAAAAIKANSIIMNGVRYVPAADTSGTYATIPAWVMPNARTVTGIPFHYCPFATRDVVVGSMPSNTTTGTNTGPAGSYTSNTITYFNHAYTRSNNYVYARTRIAFTGSGASMSPSDVLATIIAPAGTRTSININCSAIALSNTTGRITATDHYVRVVSDTQPVQQQMAAKNDTAVFYVGAITSGDGSGIDPSNRITLDAAFAQLHALKPWRAQLYLASGSYTWNNPGNIHAGGSYTSGSGKGNFRQIEYRLEGAGSGSTTITVNGDMDLPVNWQLKNLALNFSGSYRLNSPPMNTIIADGITINGGVQLKGGEMKILNTNIINNNIYVTDGGRLMLNGTLTSTVATANPAGTTGIQIRGGGRINLLGGSTWTVYNTDTSEPATYYKAPIWLRVGGRLTVQGTLNILPNSDTGGTGTVYAGINTDIGSTIVVAKSTISGSAQPIINIKQPQKHAIYLNGAMHVNNGLLLTPGWSTTDNAYIYLINGAELTLHNGANIGSSSQINERPAFGVLDLSGNSVYGGDTSQDGSSAVTIYVQANNANANSRCWAGEVTNKPHLFYDSSPTATGASDIGSNGTTSNPSDRAGYEYLRLVNISNWNCVKPAAGGNLQLDYNLN